MEKVSGGISFFRLSQHEICSKLKWGHFMHFHNSNYFPSNSSQSNGMTMNCTKAVVEKLKVGMIIQSQRIQDVIKFCRFLSLAPFASCAHCSLIIYLINDIYSNASSVSGCLTLAVVFVHIANKNWNTMKCQSNKAFNRPGRNAPLIDSFWSFLDA